MELRSGLISVLAVAAFTSACGGSDPKPSTSTVGDAQPQVCAPVFDAKMAQPFRDEMPASDNGYSATLTSDPLIPTLGDRSTFTVTLTDSAGAPVPAGTVLRAECLMSHSGGYSHGCPANIAVTDAGNGVYTLKPVIFNMQGPWTFMLHIDAASGTKDVDYQFCLQ